MKQDIEGVICASTLNSQREMTARVCVFVPVVDTQTYRGCEVHLI